MDDDETGRHSAGNNNCQSLTLLARATLDGQREATFHYTATTAHVGTGQLAIFGGQCGNVIEDDDEDDDA